MIHTGGMRFLVFILLGLFLGVPCAHADKTRDLKKIEADLQKQKETQKNLQNQQADIERKLNSVRGDLIGLGRDIQTHEQALMKVQKHKEETQENYDNTKEKLEGQRGSLAQLIIALQRLSRLPPQALLARPSAPIDTARSFNLLQHVIPTVSSQAHDVKILLEEMDALRNILDEQEKDLADQQKTLTIKRASLEKIVSERQALLKKTQRSQDAAALKASKLASQAKDLRGLLASIARQEDPAIRMKPLVNLKSTFKSWLGKSNLPVTGNIRTGFGQDLPGGGLSQGLSIDAASGAIVTSPHDGVVRFAGPFRQYKLLVIIQHPNGEHSLLGGMQELYTRTGERVAAGEPLGKLSGDSSQLSSLYYERRRNGKPIDPRSAKG